MDDKHFDINQFLLDGNESLIETLTELLTRAVNGLEWWMEMHPEDVSRADYEFIEEAKMLIE